MSAFDFITNEATIDISGSSQVSLTINGSIDLKARDASSLTYKGSGIINKIDLDEGSKVEQID